MKRFYFLLLGFFFIIQTSQAQVSGCTDPLSANYNPVATDNDGSCIYANISVAPLSSVNIPTSVSESSGLIRYNNLLLTHNDDTDTNLYSLDTITGAISAAYPLPGVVNQDWEDLAQDESFIYVGDFGNNSHGNRQNLRILRITKESFGTPTPVIDTIFFSYEDQTDFSPVAANTTDFDCEAMVASSDYLYLFTKQWTSNATAVYRIPKLNGTHTALLTGVLEVNGLVTGATYLQNRRLLVLSGYDVLLRPFVYLLYDFYGHNFFSANKRKIAIPLQFHQIEGIATTDGLRYWLTNEALSQGFLNIPAKMHLLDLTPYLSYYINNVSLDLRDFIGNRNFAVYPNPTDQTLTISIRTDMLGARYILFSPTGQQVLEGILESLNHRIDVSGLADGVYHLQVGESRQNNINVMIE